MAVDHLPETVAGDPPPPPPMMSPRLGKQAERRDREEIAKTVRNVRFIRIGSISFRFSVIFLARGQESERDVES
jgi:hypothetical protein